MKTDLFDSVFKKHFKGTQDRLLMPPPSFALMQGEFVDIDLEAQKIMTRFPVRHEFLNPYGAMQGGMIAAAVDNTIGPLSMLVAPPSVTRRMEMKYGRPVTPDKAWIYVHAEFLGEKKQELEFAARVFSSDDKILARAKAFHFIVDGLKEKPYRP